MSYGPDSTFNIGDCVLLKGGSPVMTVTHMERFRASNGVLTDNYRLTLQWVDRQGVPQKLDDIPERALEKTSKWDWYMP